MRLGGGGQVFALGAAALLKWQTFRVKVFQKYVHIRDETCIQNALLLSDVRLFCDRYFQLPR